MKTPNFFTALTAFILLTLPISAQQAAGEPVKYKDFRVSVGGGYAYRMGEIQKTGDVKIDDLNSQLRHGFALDADAHYFFKQGWGLGLNANYCFTNTSGNGISIPGISGTIGRYKETQSVLFVGPAFAARSEFSKFLLVTSLALGPLFYLDNMTLDGVKIDADKTTFGMNAGLAGEYKLNGKTGVGLKLSYTLGYIDSLNVEGRNYKADEKMSISNLMITAFVSFRSW